MTVLASIRPGGWNFPLFLHVLGAMVLVGGLFASGAATALARGERRLLRLGYWSLLGIGLPGYVAMRAGAQWIYDKEGFTGKNDPAWLGIGFTMADLGAIVLLVGLIVGGIGVYRLRGGGGSVLLKVSMVISFVLLAAYIVAVWAMGAKPD